MKQRAANGSAKARAPGRPAQENGISRVTDSERPKLFRDTLYQSLLMDRRAELHLKIAQGLEKEARAGSPKSRKRSLTTMPSRAKPRLKRFRIPEKAISLGAQAFLKNP